MKRIAICIPITETVPSEFLGTLLEVFLNNMKKYELVISFSNFFPLDMARDDLIIRSLKHKPDYIFFLDSDMILPENALDELVKMDTDIASGLYFMRAPPYKPIVKVKKDGKLFMVDQIPMNTTLEVGAVGLGCCLIKREVIEKIIEKHGEHPFEFKKKNTKEGFECISEDVDFCKKASELGFKIMLNTKIICKHVGKILVDEKNYELYLNNDENK